VPQPAPAPLAAPAAAPAPAANSRWTPENGGGGYGGGGYGGGGYGGGYGGGGGRGGGYGAQKNEQGFHGDMRPNARLEQQLFGQPTQTQGINFGNYDNIPVETSGEGVPEPYLEFPHEVLGEALVRNLEMCNYSKPTPVQKYSLPIGMAKRDMMACAQTGSGKTAGFLFPVLVSMLRDGPPPVPQDQYGRGQSRGKQYPMALILSPTRELTSQIFDEAQKFTYCTGVRSVVIYGGAEVRSQLKELERGCDLLVATPGRLVDLLERGRLSLACIKFLVLDEADRMLDMGFEPQIRDVLQHCPTPEQGRSTLFFTATWPKSVQSLAATFLKDPVQINIGDTETLTASKSITQVIKVLGGDGEKWDAFQLILSAELPAEAKTLVFSATKAGCNQVADALWSQGTKVDTLHGDKMQWERTQVLDKFRSGALQLVCCTDVAARGLDIDGITHVINYDFPAGNGAVEDYVHRIGRTGRGSNLGTAITLFTRKEAKHSGELIQILQGAGQEVPPELEALKPRWGGKGGGGRGGKGWGKGGGKGGYRGGKGGGGKGKGGGKGFSRW